MRKIVNLFIFICLFFACGKNSNGNSFHKVNRARQDIFVAKRFEMVEQQIHQRGVGDSLVLKAMRKVPRHEFVPEVMKNLAYSDRPLPIGENQTISQPYIVALMTECLGLKGGEKVLEIGTGSGYQAAVLAEIVKQVYSIEIIASLGLAAEQKLKSLGYKNIQVTIGDGYIGLLEQSPFDGIIVTAAPDHLPQPLVDQLKIGGKMIIPVGDYYQELILITKMADGTFKKKSVLPVVFVPMTGRAQKK